jgi:hypothetical protein
VPGVALDTRQETGTNARNPRAALYLSRPLYLLLVAGRPPSLSLPPPSRPWLVQRSKKGLAAMDDRRGRGRGDALGQRPFASAAQRQERVFDGGGGGGGHGPAFGDEFDQGSSLMALLSAGARAVVSSQSQPPPPTWGVEEVTAAPAINLVPQSFSMVNSMSLINL